MCRERRWSEKGSAIKIFTVLVRENELAMEKEKE